MPKSESTKNSDLLSPFLPEEQVLPTTDILQYCFEQMPDGVAYCKMIYLDGKPTDFIYLYTNPSFHKQTGLGAVVGKLVSEVIPGLFGSNPELFKIYGTVANGGDAESFEIFLNDLQLWFLVQVFSPKSEHFVATFKVINQRKSAEQSLVASEKLYKALLEDQTETICRFKADGTILYVNEAFCKFFDQSRESLIGRTWYPRVFSEDLPLINDKLNYLSPDNLVVVIENRIITSGGLLRWGQFTNHAFFDDNGVLLEMQVVGHDITENKQIQAANLELYTRLTQISSRVPGVIYQYKLRPDGSSCFPYACDAIQEIYRLTPEEVKEDAASVFACVHPEDYDGVVESIRQSAVTLEPWQYEYRVRFSDETVRWLYGNAVPDREPDGSILWHGFITDVTDRKQIEIALQTESEKNAALLRHASDGITIMDIDGKLLEASDAFCNMLGYSHEEMMGMHVSQWDAGTCESEPMNIVRTQFEQPVRFQFETRHRRKDGTIYDAEISGYPIDLNGQPVLFNSTRDITERKLAQQALQRESEKNSLFLRSASDGFHILDTNGNIIEVSNTFCVMLGYEREELIGMNVYQWDAALTKNEVAERLKQQFISSARSQFETRHRRKDGSIFDVEISGFTLELNHVPLVFYSSRDITQRKFLEAALATSTKEIQDLYNYAPCGYHSLNRDGIFIRINDTELQWLGCERDEVIGKMKFSDFLNDAGKAQFSEIYPRFVEGGHIEDLEFDLICKNGDSRQMIISAGSIRDTEGRFVMSRTVLYDITQLKKIQTELSLLTIEQQVMLDNELVGIMKLRNKQAIWINTAMERIFGYNADELDGQPSSILFLDGFSCEIFEAAANDTFNTQSTYRTQLEMKRKNGERIWVDISGVQLSDNGDQSMWMILDITPMKQHQQEVERMAYHDILTGLPNRLLVGDRLQQALVQAERANQSVAVCYLDLDGFKIVNDQFGHAAGDKLLIEVAHRMQASVRANDTIGRFGGDEFVLLLTNIKNIDEYEFVLQRVIDAINIPVSIDDATEVSVGASIGVTLFPYDRDDPDKLLRHADQAMYQAKKSGRNRVCLYETINP
ncbi:PAS domain S-box protein [Methylobacter psychrophilus]|uniref:PAS domain S-box protein n=1 Tax=Methylobacter psychrophilus TaxID=96941 RepID=UPI0021D504DD|nr:PAS domain S-box protein [Methylobacter psychrophilus]